MAPTSKKRTSLRSKAAAKNSSTGSSRILPTVSDEFSSFAPLSKTDKRIAKHHSFISKIHSTSSPRTRGKVLKRRRPGKSTSVPMASLSSLKDALPDMEDTWQDEDDDEEFEDLDRVRPAKGGTSASSKDRSVKFRSIKSRPGALRRKKLLEDIERDRFRKNMAKLVGGIDVSTTTNGNGLGGASTEGQTYSSSSDRWAALRQHIRTTMPTT